MMNEKVEKEHTSKKRTCLKNYFKNVLMNPKSISYEYKRYFLESLDNLSPLQLDVLAFLYKQKQRVKVRDISAEGIDQYFIVGSVAQLKNLGFLNAITKQISLGGDNLLYEEVQVTKLGKTFCNFCLTE